MDLLEIATTGGMAGIVMVLAWWLRGWLERLVSAEAVTRLMPLVVVVLAAIAVAGATLLPVPMIGYVQQVVLIAIAATGLYSSGKAAMGRS